MCGKYVSVQILEVLEKEFNAQMEEEHKELYKPNYNVGIGELAPIICSDTPEKIQMCRFGLIPAWSEKKLALFNARAEGDYNKNDDPNYNGTKGIITKPSFRKQIRSQRCLVIADCFIEGTEENGWDEPYLVYLQGRRPFSFAGIWDDWKDPVSGEIIRTFAIITTTANSLLRKIPHKRMPVILPKYEEKRWLSDKTPLADITKLLKQYPAEKMNAYAISPLIKDKKNNSAEFLKSVSDRLQPEYEYKVTNHLELHGMGRYKHKPTKDNE